MSVFQHQTLACPSCGEPVPFEVVHSVNADRRSDLRDAILDGTFQAQPCPSCEKEFRLDPQLNYLHIGAHQWIAAHPLDRIGEWEDIESKDQALFDRGYGSGAPATARAIGEGMIVRVVFGWAALREKVLLVEHGLDDVELELMKIAILQSSGKVENGELRLVDMVEDTLALAWIDPKTGAEISTMRAPREVYDEIVADRDEWQPLREQLSAGAFVDMQRLLIPSA
jgi:hypothetical protein